MFLNLDPAGEGSVGALLVPSLSPVVGAHGVVHPAEPLAGLIVLSLDLLASVEVQVALVAIPGLVLVGEARIKWRCPEIFFSVEFLRWQNHVA